MGEILISAFAIGFASACWYWAGIQRGKRLASEDCLRRLNRLHGYMAAPPTPGGEDGSS